MDDNLPPGEYDVRPVIGISVVDETGIHVDAIVEVQGGAYDGAQFPVHVRHVHFNNEPLHYDGDR